MNRIFRKPLFYLALLVTLSIAGCYSELSNLEVGSIKWNPELGVPLIDSKFTLTEILESNATALDFTVDNNNTIVLSLSEDNLFRQSASSYFSLGDEIVDVPPILLLQEEINTFNQTGQVTVTREIFADYPRSGRLNEIIIDQGTIITEVEENFPANVNLEISMEDSNTTPIINYSGEFVYSGGDPVNTDQSTSQFNNAQFIFNGEPNQSQVKLTFEMTLDRVSEDLSFGENAIDLTFNFQDQEFGELIGDLDPKEISTDISSLRTDFFSEFGLLNDINYYFEDPQFRLILSNSMGLPVRFDINEFISYSGGSPSNEAISNSIEIAKSVGGSASVSELNFDDAFKAVFNNLPDSISLQVDGLIDPGDTEDNFVTRDSYIQLGYEINLPLEFSLSGFEINETVALGGIDPQELQYALFKFTSENSLPFDLDFKADLLDADSTFIANLFDGKFLAGGTEQSPASISDIIRIEDDPNTSANELDNLQNVRRVGIRATISTTNNGSEVVRITSDASIQFNLAVQAQYNVNL